ncbi:MAG: hypothetical protein KTR27_15555 [Leptolyngbyaceae cyanobacterium MAG.088]|nr:hypothetical protein [Leptolyngbyaceae cyanobacterium MAG.088]
MALAYAIGHSLRYLWPWCMRSAMFDNLGFWGKNRLGGYLPGINSRLCWEMVVSDGNSLWQNRANTTDSG